MKTVVTTLCAATLLSLSGGASAQAFPTKPLRMFTTEPGGSLDLAARILASGLSSGLGQSVVVENRSGAGGAIAVEAVKAAPADGYSLGFYSSGFWITPLMQPVPYDGKDFAPVVLAVSSPSLLVVNPSQPVKSVKDLIALAKAKPGELSFGASATGSGPHLAAELFRATTGINVVHIPYKGGAPTVADLLAGRLQFAFTSPGTVAGSIKAGKLRGIAVTSEKASALVPDLPPISETLPGFSAAIMQGMWVLAQVPKPIITRLNQESVKVLNRADIKQKFLDVGAEVAAGTPEEFEAIVKAEVAKLGPVIKAAGIKAE